MTNMPICIFWSGQRLHAAALQRRVDQAGEDRDGGEDEDGVQRAHLRRLHRVAEDLAVHALGLQHPGGPVLEEEGPEGGDGAKTPTMRKTALAPSTASAGNRARAGSSQCSPGRVGPQPLDGEPDHPEEAVRVGAGGRDVHVEATTAPEDDERERHEHAGDREGHPGTEAGQQLGDDEHGGEGAQVDHPVVEVVDLLEQVLAPRVELVAHVGRRGGLDAARADGDEREARARARSATPRWRWRRGRRRSPARARG